MIPHPILAHSWGWDEVLYFVVPLGLALLWIRWVEKRSGTRKDAGDAAAADAENVEGPDGDPQP